MLEIVFLIWLSNTLKKRAASYGISAGGYIAAFVVGWIVWEILAVVMFMGGDSPLMILPLAYGGGIAIYFLVRMFLDKAGEAHITTAPPKYQENQANQQGQQGSGEDFF
ncbi:MAG: hypothetical protein H6581_10985 [Bacteroidia bacterium]|nr:hypothetical protein [Bacteroidia bacterium]